MTKSDTEQWIAARTAQIVGDEDLMVAAMAAHIRPLTLALALYIAADLGAGDFLGAAKRMAESEYAAGKHQE